MNLKYFLLSSIAVLTLAACNNDKPGSSEASTAPVVTEQTAEEAAQAFFDNVISGDLEGAIDLVYIPKDDQSDGYLAKVKSEVEKGHKYLGGDDPEVVAVEAGQAAVSATIPVTMTGKDGDSQTKEFDLIKTTEGWKIDMRNAF